MGDQLGFISVIWNANERRSAFAEAVTSPSQFASMGRKLWMADIQFSILTALWCPRI